MIVKPLKKILFFEKASNNLLFTVDCIDGRAKWKESMKIISLKFQVSKDVEEVKNLYELKEGNQQFDFEIVSFGNFDTASKIRFYDFTVLKLELRSFTMSVNKNGISYWRFFIEGNAATLKTITNGE